VIPFLFPPSRTAASRFGFASCEIFALLLKIQSNLAPMSHSFLTPFFAGPLRIDSSELREMPDGPPLFYLDFSLPPSLHDVSSRKLSCVWYLLYELLHLTS